MSTVEETRVDVSELTALELHGPIRLQSSAVQGIQKMLELIDEECWREPPHHTKAQLHVLSDSIEIVFSGGRCAGVVSGTFENHGNDEVGVRLHINDARMFAYVVQNATGPITIEVNHESSEGQPGNVCNVTSGDMTASVHIWGSDEHDKPEPRKDEVSYAYLSADALGNAVRVASNISAKRADGLRESLGVRIESSISDAHPHVEVSGAFGPLIGQAEIKKGVSARHICDNVTYGMLRTVISQDVAESVGRFSASCYSRAEIHFYGDHGSTCDQLSFAWTKDGSEGRDRIELFAARCTGDGFPHVGKIFGHIGRLNDTNVTVKQLRDAVNRVQGWAGHDDELAMELQMSKGSAIVSTDGMTIGPFGIPQYIPRPRMYGDLRKQGVFTASILALALAYDGKLRYADRYADKTMFIEVRTREMRVTYLIAGRR